MTILKAQEQHTSEKQAEADAYDLSKSNRLITEKNLKHGRGLGKQCYLCGKTILAVPYFAHLSGGSHRMHYYHYDCAKKVNFL